jgi:cell division protein FtsB
LLRDLKRRLLATLPPAIFLAITGYFAWNAVHGARGLEAQAAERTQLVHAKLQFTAVDADRQLWETKIAALGNQSIDPDMLDAELRQILSLAGPADLVVNLPTQVAK